MAVTLAVPPASADDELILEFAGRSGSVRVGSPGRNIIHICPE